MTTTYPGMSIQNSWNQMWNQGCVNLLQDRNIRSNTLDLSPEEPTCNCDRDVMRSTLKKIPESPALLQKSRLPFGILIHPFRNDKEIPVIQDRSIVRCRSCRTYINPFVRLLDQRRWQCNLCHRVNDLPDDFLLEPRTNGYHSYSPNQPELCSGTVEFIASVEYMVRPPQPAAYLFVFDVSAHAYHLGYVPLMAKTILDCLNQIPGDGRTLIGFIGFDSKLHFFNLGEKQPQHLVVPDVQDVFLPAPENLLVNLQAKQAVIEEFLSETLPNFAFVDKTYNPGVVDSGCALGAALTAAYKVISPIGGRVTVFQAGLPSRGSPNDGSVLSNREDPNNRTTSNSNVTHLTPLLNPVTDFYKKLALDFNEHQVAVDLFNLCASYSDMATVGQVAKISGGSIFYYGGTVQINSNPSRVLDKFTEELRHYLTRDIGLEAVMRLRCTRGLSIHTFHGNFFVRSTDLLALPNCNPDSGYAMQISIDEDIKDFNAVCFQAAVLYTNAAGERRIRVHTLSMPVVGNMGDVINGMDQDAVVGLLAKMAVDRTLTSTLIDAREALVNAVLDLISTYRNLAPFDARGDLVICHAGRLLPLYVSALLKHTAFRIGLSTKIDERTYAMEKMKTLPICYLINYIYPNLYPLHYGFNYEMGEFPKPLQLSFANIERNGVYLLDTFDCVYIYICKSVHPHWLSEVFGVSQWSQIPDDGEFENQHPPGKPMDVTQRANTSLLNKTPLASNNFSHSSVQPTQNGPYVNDSRQSKLPPNPVQTSQAVQRGHQSDPQTHSVALNENQLVNGYSARKSSIVPLPLLENQNSRAIHAFIHYLLDSRPTKPHFFILREDSRLRYSFLQYMYDDRSESALSYYEFLQHLQQQLRN